MLRRLQGGATPLLIAVIVFLASALVSAFVVRQLESHRLDEERARVADLAGDHAQALQRNLERTLSATYALAAMVRQGNGEFPAFEDVARQMLRYFPSADSLQLAPGGVTRRIVPLAGNEAGLGRDLLRDPLRNKEALLARDSRQLTLAGPFELIQGGIGVIGRLPVFLDDAGNGERFWGFATVVIRFPGILEQIGLTRLPERGFAYQLWRVHPDTGERQIIAASSATLPAGAIDHPVSVPNGTWTLSLSPVAGWADPAGLTFKIAVGLLFSMLLTWLAKLLIVSKAHEAELEALVAERTAEIGESEHRLRQIEDNLPESYVYQYIHASDGAPRFLYISAGVERVHGVAVEAVLRDAGALHRQVDPAQWPALAAAEAASLREMRDFAMELRMQCSDGEWRWLQLRSRPRRKADGQVVWDGVATDITVRRQAEEALRLERDFSATVLDSLPEILYLFDDQLRYLRWNRNTERVLGYCDEEIARMSPLDFFAGDDRQRVSDRIRQVFEQGTADIEADLVAKNGARLPYYLTGTRIMIDGRLCLLGVGVDIAARRRAEETLARQAEELRRRNEELERFDAAAVGRELRMVELKRQINALSLELGRRAPYDLAGFGNEEDAGNIPSESGGEPS